jgi:hypothetical protein
MSIRSSALSGLVALVLMLPLIPVAASAQGDSGPDIILVDVGVTLGLGFANISVVDESVGLLSINVLEVTNGSASIPPFVVTTTDPVITHLGQIDAGTDFGVVLGACNTNDECSQAQFQFAPNANVAAVARIPEPTTLTLVAMGVGGLMAAARCRRRDAPPVM